MRPLLALAALALLVLPTGCTRMFRLSPVTEPGIDMIYQSGRQVAVAEDDTARVTVSGARISGEYMALRIGIANKTDGRLDVIPDQLQVLASVDRSRRYLKVHDPDQLLKNVRFQQGMVAFLSALGDATGPSTSTTTTSGAVVKSPTQPGTPPARETYRERSVTVVSNPAAEAQARELQRARQEREAASNEQRNRELSESLLRATSLFKQDRIEGLVYVEAVDGTDFQVTVPVGPKRYTIRFLAIAEN